MSGEFFCSFWKQLFTKYQNDLVGGCLREFRVVGGLVVVGNEIGDEMKENYNENQKYK